MLLIDGSAGEGGGQVLRTALGLSLVTGTAFRITRIRGGRAKPGLLRQHLTCVKAAVAIGAAEVEGEVLGSSELVFRPKALRSGAFEFHIGSAGSTTLVLQAVLPGLLRAPGPSTIAIEGGTHNGMAPPFEFLTRSFVPAVARLGAQLSVRLVRYGFEPAGGGRIEVTVTPAELKPMELMERGSLLGRSATAVVSRVPVTVAERELAVVRSALDFTEDQLHVQEVASPGPGNALSVALQYENVTEVFVGLGARGVSAEQVGRAVTVEVKTALRTEAPVGEHLADQLVIPMALAGGGVFRTVRPTLHTLTQLELIPRFLGVSLSCVLEAKTGCSLLTAKP